MTWITEQWKYKINNGTELEEGSDKNGSKKWVAGFPD